MELFAVQVSVYRLSLASCKRGSDTVPAHIIVHILPKFYYSNPSTFDNPCYAYAWPFHFIEIASPSTSSSQTPAHDPDNASPSNIRATALLIGALGIVATREPWELYPQHHARKVGS